MVHGPMHGHADQARLLNYCSCTCICIDLLQQIFSLAGYLSFEWTIDTHTHILRRECCVEGRYMVLLSTSLSQLYNVEFSAWFVSK